MSESTGEVTRILQAAREGDAGAGHRLADLVYAELHAVASARAQRAGTLQPTALVNEVWLKLHGNLASLQDRQHFFAVASQAMRQVLANHARAARADKRGQGLVGVTLDADPEFHDSALGLIALDDALSRLAQANERHARVVELRFLGSLSIQETAEVLGVSTPTVERDWAFAKAWLRRELSRN